MNKTTVNIACILLLVALLWATLWLVPNHYNPFEPLRLSDPVTFVTKIKLNKLKRDQDACRELLKQSTLSYEPIEDRKTGSSCGFKNAFMLKQSSISYGGEITLTCPALIGLMLWETNHVQVLAEEIFNQKVVRIRHYGTYSCRNINNAQTGKRSEHAYANAIDISGFMLQDGTEISVLSDWINASDKGDFIRELHESACLYFKTVLGPQYNDLHKDHFHFDMGSSYACK